MSIFLPCFLRKYSPIHSVCFLKQGRFYSTHLLRNIYGCQLHKSSLNFVPRIFSKKPTEICSYYSYTGTNYGGTLKLFNSLNFYKVGNVKCRQGFYNYWMLSKIFNCRGQSRNFSNSRNPYQQRNRTTAIYTVAIVIVVLGVSYAAVPLYRIFCQVDCISCFYYLCY